MLRVIFACIFLIYGSVCNVVKNPGFEITTLSELGFWFGNGGNVSLETHDVHGGKFAMKAYNRTRFNQGPSQYIDIKPGSRYTLSVYVKHLNEETGSQFPSYTAAEIQVTDATSNKRHSINVARQPHIQTTTGWFLLKGSFITPTGIISNATLTVQGPHTGVEFLVDDFSLEEIPENTNWETEANSRINEIRKSKIHFIFTLSPHLNRTDLTVQINHKRHLFGFGAFIDPSSLSKPKYRQLLKDNFNTATIKTTLRGGQLDSHDAVNAAAELKKNRITVHGQDLFGEIVGTKHLIQEMQENSVNQTIQEILNYMINTTKGLINHWNVLDNLIDLKFLEKSEKEIQNAQHVYQMLHEADPSAVLYTTEHGILEEGYKTHAFTELMKMLKNCNINAIAAKTSFTRVPPDPTMLKYRLDEIGSIGLPVWISGMDVTPPEDKAMADWFEMILRVYFSHPSVEGVTITAFVDPLHLASRIALFSGHDFKTTETAQRYLDLVKKEWSTNITHSLSQGTSFTTEGFQGDYEIFVYDKGIPIMHGNLHLGKSDVVYKLHIDENIIDINKHKTSKAPKRTTTSPLPHTTDNLLNTGAQRALSTAISQADHDDLQCVTRFSNISTANQFGTTYVSCSGSEILTGCSALKENVTGGDWYNDGELIKLQVDGKIVCKALNGAYTKTGLFAVARCCSARNFTCEYRASSPSKSVKGARTLVSCTDQFVAAGCAGSQFNSHLHGAYPTVDGKGCLSENGGFTYGVQSSAACCKSPDGLTCTTVTSPPSDLPKGSQASVTCGSNQDYVMTGCNGRSTSGEIAGSYIINGINGDMCVAFNGRDKKPGEEGVRASGICCKMDQTSIQKTPLIG